MNIPAGNDYRRIGAADQMLKVAAQDVANMSVKINAGSYVGESSKMFSYEGGNSPVISVPTMGAFWVFVALQAGKLTILYGQAAADNQEFPAVPKNTIVLAGIFIKSTDTAITADMIFDMRPVFSAAAFQSDHNDLANRDIADCHPMSAITGLDKALSDKISAAAVSTMVASKADADGSASKKFVLNKNETGAPVNDVYISVNRGNQPTASIRYNETENHWEFTDDGANYKPFDKSIDVNNFHADNYYVRTEIDTKIASVSKALADKADSAIVNKLVDDVANAASQDFVANQLQNIYSKDAMDKMMAEIKQAAASVSEKADLTAVYTKVDADAKFAPIATAAIKDDVDASLALKANVADVYAKADVDKAIADKISTTNAYTKVDVDAMMDNKASISDVYKYVDAQMKSTLVNKQDALGFIPEDSTKKGVANGYAALDGNGKIVLAQLPDSAKQETYVVATSAEREALTDLVSGAKAYETTTGDSYIYDGKAQAWKVASKANWENVNINFSNLTNIPSTLAEHKITNAFTKDEIAMQLANKAEKAHTHAPIDIVTDDTHQFITKAQLESIAAKADAASTYTSAAIDSTFVKKTDLQTTMSTALTDYVKTATADATYAKATDVAAKANSADVYSKTDADAKYSLYVTKDSYNAHTDDAAKTIADLKAQLANVISALTTVKALPTFEAKSVAYGTEFSALALPATVSVTLEDDTAKDIPVVWDSKTYDKAVEGTQNVSGALTMPKGYINTLGKNPVYPITVGKNPNA